MSFFITNDYPGAYPASASQRYIVADLLKKMIYNNGKLPCQDVINPAHPPETRKRLSTIVDEMSKKALIEINGDYLIIKENGRQALDKVNKGFANSRLGGLLSEYLPKIAIAATGLVILAVILYAGYMMMIHHTIVDMTTGAVPT